MGVNNETLYLKIEQNTIVFDRHVVLNDIAKMECTNEAVLRQLKEKKAGITRNIRKSIGRLDRVANGDLTVQEKEKRKKGGEFGKLFEALFHTITRM